MRIGIFLPTLLALLFTSICNAASSRLYVSQPEFVANASETVSVTLTLRSNGSGVGGRLIRIYNGDTVIRSVRTGSRGTVTFSLRVPIEGTTTYRAAFAGDSAFGSSSVRVVLYGRIATTIGVGAIYSPIPVAGQASIDWTFDVVTRSKISSRLVGGVPFIMTLRVGGVTYTAQGVTAAGGSKVGIGTVTFRLPSAARNQSVSLGYTIVSGRHYQVS